MKNRTIFAMLLAVAVLVLCTACANVATLLLARGEVAWGATADVLTGENLQQARRMCEAFDDSAGACAVDQLPSKAA